jgi:hypothetical protein
LESFGRFGKELWVSLQICGWAALGGLTGAGAEAWKPLFDGKSLAGWAITDFAGHGEVEVRDGNVMVGLGAALTGIHWTNAYPKVDYELRLEAKKVDGSDFFCGLTFPFQDTFCSLIVGGWGGGVVGLSSLDSQDASMNETTKYLAFEKDRWYRIRLRVAAERIEAWLDDDRVVDLETKDRRIGLRLGEIELSKPLGFAAWMTRAAWRKLELRRLDRPVDAPKAPQAAPVPARP